jgi:hypothetical protein
MECNKENQHSNPVLPLFAQMIPRGDGTFVVKPRLPDRDLDTWISVKDAAALLGNISPRTVYGWLGKYLVSRKASKRKVIVSLKSALRLKQAMQDADFWEDALLQQHVRDEVQSTMSEMKSASAATC